MEFSNLIFIFVFLSLTMTAYFLVPGLKGKNWVLLIASLIFYAWGEPVYVLLLAFSAWLNYRFGRMMGNKRQKKTALVLAVTADLVLLGIFKYTGFLVSSFNAVTGLAIPVPAIELPIGISFYTFQAMSYVIDAYRGNVQIQRSYPRFLLYVSLFPQLVAGPIVRYADVEAQLSQRHTTPKMALEGMSRACVGLAKKVLIADYASRAAAEIFKKVADTGAADAQATLHLTVVGAWLGAIFLMLRIYFDFSGYSDMAIGMGKIFGFHYNENFDHPYIAGSITEFWRRWHISLSSFFRDYLYIPLGGNRKGLPRQILNLFIVWSLTGLWHGASWNYVLWGVYFFLLLTFEKLCSKQLEAVPGWLRHTGTLLLVLISWVIFQFKDLADTMTTLAAMAGFAGGGFTDSATNLRLINNLPLLVIAIFGATPVMQTLGRTWRNFAGGGMARKLYGRRNAALLGIVDAVVTCLFCAGILYLATMSLIGEGYSPSIYFDF